MNNIPDWVKSGGFIICVMILWDIVRIFIQAWVNKKFLQKEFDNLEDVIEEESGEEGHGKD